MNCLLRDIGVTVVMLFVGLQLLAQGAKQGPAFAEGDISVVEAAVAGHETVQVFETAPAPNLNTQAGVSRSALRLEGFPPNLLAYIPGTPWRLENDIPLGTVVRLEVAEDAEALAARARAFPETSYLLPIEGLQIGERDFFRAIDEVQRAEAASRRSRVIGVSGLLGAAVWLGWSLWSRRNAIGRLVEAAREST